MKRVEVPKELSKLCVSAIAESWGLLKTNVEIDAVEAGKICYRLAIAHANPH